MKLFGNTLRSQIGGRFEKLYGLSEGNRCLERLEAMIGRYGVGLDMMAPQQLWDEKDAVLITYGDMVSDETEPPLQTLANFLDEFCHGAVNTVHVLPFFPYSSDDGFSVIDYGTVNPLLGGWDDIQRIAKKFRLMVDLVLNHVSRESRWFQDYVSGISPCRRFFIEMAPGTDLSAVMRPRSGPILHRINTREIGRAHV